MRQLLQISPIRKPVVKKGILSFGIVLIVNHNNVKYLPLINFNGDKITIYRTNSDEIGGYFFHLPHQFFIPLHRTPSPQLHYRYHHTITWLDIFHSVKDYKIINHNNARDRNAHNKERGLRRITRGSPLSIELKNIFLLTTTSLAWRNVAIK